MICGFKVRPAAISEFWMFVGVWLWSFIEFCWVRMSVCRTISLISPLYLSFLCLPSSFCCFHRCQRALQSCPDCLYSPNLPLQHPLVSFLLYSLLPPVCSSSHFLCSVSLSYISSIPVPLFRLVVAHIICYEAYVSGWFVVLRLRFTS